VFQPFYDTIRDGGAYILFPIDGYLLQREWMCREGQSMLIFNIKKLFGLK